MTYVYVFVRHRLDGKFEVRFSARWAEEYRLLLLSLRAYVPQDARRFDMRTRTWVVGGRYSKEIELWAERMAEEVNAEFDLYCEIDNALKSKAEESYRALHLLPGAPREVVKAAYRALTILRGFDSGGSHDEVGTLTEVYETIMAHVGEDDHEDR